MASQAADWLPATAAHRTHPRSTIGQIYVPWINGALMVMVLILVSRSVQVRPGPTRSAWCRNITITTTLFFYYAHTRWRWPLWVVLTGGGLLLLVDLMFLAANMTKLVHGAWLPLLIAIIAFTVMTTWEKGREIVTRAREKADGPLREFINGLRDCEPPLVRMPGTAVFLNRGKETAPLAMRANVEHNRVVHEHVIIMSIDTMPVPRLSDDERTTIDELGYHQDGIIHVRACYGYMERPNIPAALRLLDPAHTEGPIDVDAASYFLSKLELTDGDEPTMAPWRKQAFHRDVLHHLRRRRPISSLPLERTVIIGSRIEVNLSPSSSSLRPYSSFRRLVGLSSFFSFVSLASWRPRSWPSDPGRRTRLHSPSSRPA